MRRFDVRLWRRKPDAAAGPGSPPRKLELAVPGLGIWETTTGTGRAKLLRPKGHLSKTELRVLLVLALLPLVLVVLRVLALPGVVSPGPLGALRSIGSALNQTFSLSAVPPDQREHVLYLLFLPTCALLVALARLTFGIRVLGFRSILISVGFHQSGIIPSLLLITVAVATIVIVRPWLRRIKLPYYARVSVILCIVATTMVAALLVSPWMHSDVLWGVAYFPVIVLGMLAEGIAHTLDRDNMITASWRAITTILLAFLIVLVCQIPLLRDALLQFPELVVTQIVAVILVSEFLDFRLFQDWDTKAAGIALPKLFSRDGKTRVAVVRNRVATGVIGRLGRPGPKKFARRSVQKIVDALRRGGHTVKVVEGDTTLLKELRQFIPPHPKTGDPGGIVFNLAYGIQGDAGATHVPAMLEMAGIAYTGAAPQGHALALDRAAAKALLREAGCLTPAFWLLSSPRDSAPGLRYPVTIRPRYEPGVRAALARDRQQLEQAVKKLVRRYGQEVIVEERVRGRQISAALLGNDPVECLPLVEISARDKVCPAPTDKALATRIRDSALAAFRACDCRDYARVDLRLDELGNPNVIAVHTIDILAAKGSFALAASKAGYTFDQLICRILDIARSRYRKSSSVRPLDPDRKKILKAEGLLSSKVSPMR